MIGDFGKLKEQRKPIFIISKDFLPGKDFKAGVFTEAGITPYPVLSQANKLQEAPLNLTEIALEAGTTKDNVKLCLQRVIREMLASFKKGMAIRIDIPSLGTLNIRSGIAAMKFYDNIIEDLAETAKKDLKNKSSVTFLLPGESASYRLDTDQVSQSSRPILIEDAASQYLKKELDIDVKSLSGSGSGMNRKNLSKLLQVMEVPNKQVRSATASQSGSASFFSNQSFDVATYVNKIILWIRNNQFTILDAFHELVTEVYGLEASSGAKLSFEDFIKAMKKMDIRISNTNAKRLFNVLDKNKDHYIDMNDWSSTIAKDEAPVRVLHNILKKHGYGTKKLLESIGINRETSFVDRKLLYDGLVKMNPDIKHEDIADVAEKLLEGRDFIEVEQLVQMLEVQQDDERKNTKNTKELIAKVKAQLITTQKRDQVKHLLEEAASGNGQVNAGEFKSIMMRYMPNLTTGEVNQLARNYESHGNTINLSTFEDDFQGDVTIKTHLPLKFVASEISKYLQTRKLEIQVFLRKLSALEGPVKAQPGGLLTPDMSPMTKYNSHKVTAQGFGQFIRGNILNNSTSEECQQIAERIDIDQDGFISKEDLEIFMKRGALLSKGQKASSLAYSQGKQRLFPTEPLCEKDIENLLRELRGIMESLKLTNYELFAKLDANEDGFATIDEFCVELEKIIPLPRPITEGFFAYIDKQKIGVLDLESFLKVMKKSIYVKERKEIEDNFDWPINMIKRIQAYFEDRGVTKEDAFKMVDGDFDGNISKPDLKKFLIKIMSIPAEEVTDPRLDRLFKLLDRYKRGTIQPDDLEKIFDISVRIPTNNDTFLKTQKSMESKELSFQIVSENQHFDWKNNARQQVGLIISRNYDSLKTSFDVISMYTSKIVYKTFKAWIEDNNVLQGFNLTSNLMMQFFADLDPHRKGYLTYNDWQLAFQNYNWNTQILDEFRNILYTNFTSIDAAFNHFYLKGSNSCQRNGLSLESGSYFGEKEFKEGFRSVLPSRFSSKELDSLWERLTHGTGKMTYFGFNSLLESRGFRANKTNFSRSDGFTQEKAIFFKPTCPTSPRLNTLNGTFMRSNRESCSLKTFEKLKKNIRTGKLNIVDLFKEVDILKNGMISSLEFRNVLMKLNIELSPVEIGQLLDFANVGNTGSIDWRSFVNRILLKESEVNLFQRYKEKLNQMKENIYAYMLTPKDAFLKFNMNGSGRLTYEEFTGFVHELCRVSKDEVPALAIIRDLFEFIDVKKDGVIDIKEWTQTFNQLPVSFFIPRDFFCWDKAWNTLNFLQEAGLA